MDDGSRNIIVMILIVAIVLVSAFLAIVYTTYQIFVQTGGFFPEDETRSEIPFIFVSPNDSGSNEQPQYQVINNYGNYAFEIKEEGYYKVVNQNESINYNFAVSPANSDQFNNIEVGEKDESFVNEVKNIQKSFDSIEFGDITSVSVPSIGVNSPVFQGINGDELLDNGWWLYPGSYSSESGEKILYCHRRYFGRLDPRTCWNMNQVIVGDEILLTNTSGEQFVYKVISTSIVHQDTSSLMKPSSKDYVKIVTCGAQNGAPGGNDWRVVVLGELVK